METFQKIYRPEIYNANSVAGKSYQPSLKHEDYSLTRICFHRTNGTNQLKVGVITQQIACKIER
jgi:hypothetical protein